MKIIKEIKKILPIIFIISGIGMAGYSQVPFKCTGQLFLTLEPETGQQLVEVNIDPFGNNAVFNIINNDLGITINAIGYRKIENLIYGVDPVDHILYRIDATGQVEVIKKLELSAGFQYFAGEITLNGVYLLMIGVQDGFRAQFVRINLSDENYTTELTEMSELVRIFDIAFDPLTGILYGYDGGFTGQLVQIDPSNGDIIKRYERINIREAAGLFFDAFGNLYAYGGTESNNTVYLVNKETGKFNFYVNGTSVRNADATSCPYTIEIIKEVTPIETVPCSEVIYTFKIANGSGRTIDGIDFEDQLPEGFIILELLRNPYNGLVSMEAEIGLLKIDDMVIPEGIDSISIRVEIPDVPPGSYANQATLVDLPIDLGTSRVSDNPRTTVENDSTVVWIKGTSWDSLIVSFSLCNEDQQILDASPYGASYIWSTGETTAQIEPVSGATYTVVAIFGCDTNYVQFNLSESSLSIDVIDEGPFTLQLGDSIWLSPRINSSFDTFNAVWVDPLRNSLSCIDCIETWARPFSDVQYTFTVIGELGCSDSIQLTISVDKSRDIFFPNVFTPNNDGINDFFSIQSPNFGIIHKFSVFNRWGNIVYILKEPTHIEFISGWDGMYNGQIVDAAVFVWLAEIEFLDGQIELFSGDLTVLK